MSDQRKQQLVEQYEDLALSMLMEDYAQAEGERLLREFEEAERNGELPEMPEELDRKCRNLIETSFAKQARGQRLKKIVRMASKAAVYAAVFLGLSTITILSVDALRMPVLNFLMDQSGRYSTVVYQNDPVTQIPEGDPVLARFENNLPEGYRVVDIDAMGSYFTVFCKSENQDSIYLKSTLSVGGLNIDAEVTEYIDKDLSGHKAVFWDKEGYHLMWLDEETEIVYTLLATGLDENSFWKFAYTLAD